MALAVLLTIAEALLPLVDWLPDLHYSALSIVTIIGAMWARIVAQRGL
jgi:predicted tellurium resistance membrane protein TerC